MKNSIFCLFVVCLLAYSAYAILEPCINGCECAKDWMKCVDLFKLSKEGEHARQNGLCDTGSFACIGGL